MSANETEHTPMAVESRHGSHKGVLAGLAAGLVVALSGDAYLLVKSNDLSRQLAQAEAGTQTQIAKLNEATTTLLDQEKKRLDDMAEQMKAEMKGVTDSANSAIRRARSETQKQSQALSSKLAEQQQQVAAELSQLRDTTSSKFNEVATDVNGVKANVEEVKTNVAAAQSQLDKAASDLKRMMGDMGVMSGLIATNSKDLETLRALGERNYFEFDLTKAQKSKRVGDITLQLKKTDPKHNRYTLDILADDKHVEKKDKTINEPVQLYVGGNRQPYEIVVNQVNKDQIVGYLATPKVKTASR
jgi:DNA repair exonuclease SbcCD ATPase subunit